MLDDSRVSRRHAEVVLATDGRYFITDRNSTGGSFVYGNSGWHPVRQRFVRSTDRLRFGNHEIVASRLESLCVLAGGGGGATTETESSGQKAVCGGADQATEDGPDPNKGLMRDPVTGEVIEKSS